MVICTSPTLLKSVTVAGQEHHFQISLAHEGRAEEVFHMERNRDLLARPADLVEDELVVGIHLEAVTEESVLEVVVPNGCGLDCPIQCLVQLDRAAGAISTSSSVMSLASRMRTLTP